MIKETVTISVRALVEFLLRSGDIDNRRRTAPEEAMLAGGRIHRMLQKKGGPEYRAEVSLRHIVEGEKYDLKIEGRADGIIDGDDGTVIDEIKGVYRDLKYIDKPVEVHLAQAKCYAWIYAYQNEIDNIQVRMTYCNLDTLELKYFHETYSFDELTEWFQTLLSEYRKWADFSFEWKERRNKSAEKLEFPYEFREGQKDLASGVYKTIYHEKRLFLMAPTGVGKTLAVLFPSIKALGKRLGDRIFYLTAKNITATVAVDTFSLLRKHGLKIKTVSIQAKEKMCLLEKPQCDPENCPYAKGHFDRINNAIYSLLQTEDEYGRDFLREYGEKHKLCPFELGLDISLFSDAVICDYNYVFDPNVKLKRFFGEGIRGDYIFLIDEAHNLVDRAREMFSATLYKEDFLTIKRIISEEFPSCAEALSRCNKRLLSMKKEGNGFAVGQDMDLFLDVLQQAAARYDDMLETLNRNGKSADDTVLEFYFAIRDFLSAAERKNDNYANYTELDELGRFMIRILCVNPSADIKRCLEKGRSTVFFSATLLPVNYYMDLLSGDRSDYAMYAHSSFDSSKRAVFIGTDVSSRYTRRNEKEYRHIAEYLKVLPKARKGNYMAFFPSYAFMEAVYEQYQLLIPEDEEVEALKQESHMTEEMRERFLNRFMQRADSADVDLGKSVMGFCVLGGIFSEGIDLRADSLIGAVIVGTGIPQVCNERQILKEYFEEKGYDGFDYAYRFPGMNKVLQAAGRVIRTEEDRGIVLLLDDRFRLGNNRSLFPREWNDVIEVSSENILEHAENFWKSE